MIGASGSGKSTLLRCADLLEEIDDGDIFLDGEVITDPSVDAVAVRRRLGLVFQAYNLFPHLTVLENVVLGMAAATASPATRPRRAARAQLERLGLGGPRGRPARPSSPAASSSASRWRARSPPGRGRCCSTRSPRRSTRSWSARCCRPSATLKAEGVTMLIATHEMSFAREVADTVGFLHEGRLVEVGPPEQVLESPAASPRPSASCAACSRRASVDAACPIRSGRARDLCGWPSGRSGPEIKTLGEAVREFAKRHSPWMIRGAIVLLVGVRVLIGEPLSWRDAVAVAAMAGRLSVRRVGDPRLPAAREADRAPRAHATSCRRPATTATTTATRTT